MIKTQSLTKTFGETSGNRLTAVKCAGLEVLPGQMVLVMGPSGSGKTTLLSMIGGLLKPSSGRVLLMGTDIHGLHPRQRAYFRLMHVGFVFQSYRLLEMLTALENVELVLHLRGIAGRTARNRAAELLERMGVSGCAQRMPRQLSGGEQQRVALARALANEPAVVLADEPTGSLDAASGAAVVDLLRSAADETGAAVLIASHDARVRARAHRLLRIHDGRLQEDPNADVC